VTVCAVNGSLTHRLLRARVHNGQHRFAVVSLNVAPGLRDLFFFTKVFDLRGRLGLQPVFIRRKRVRCNQRAFYKACAEQSMVSARL